MITLLIIPGVIVLVGLWAVGVYNGLVRCNLVRQIDVVHRHDLIGNLVETVKVRGP